MISNEMYKYTFGRAPRANRYIKREKVMNERYAMAEKELNKEFTDVDQIIFYTLEFLEKFGFDNPQVIKAHNTEKYINSKTKKEMYASLKQEYKLNDERHIVWMKFTKIKHLGVVAASNDINYDMNTTSSEIINHLNQEWDENIVVIFPLPNIGDKERADIECGIGNYLICKDIPILDFYSHRYK